MSFSGFQQAIARNVNDLSGTQRSLGLGGIIPVPSTTLTYTEIAAGLTQDKTVTVSGASVGDIVLVGAPALAAGYMVSAFVSAANTVTVRLANNTAGALTPGALIFNILVIKL